MARKPAPGLPDVFARPGAAPARGTPIEDLPQTAPPSQTTSTPIPQLPPEVAKVSEPRLPPEPRPVPEPVAETRAPPVTEPPVTPDWQPVRAPVARSGSALTIAIIALVASLTAPFWEDSLLSTIGIRTHEGRTAERNTLAVERQDQRMADIGQRVAALSAQIAKLQGELAASARRTEQAAAMTRTMALVRLSDTLRRPIPFAAELALVRASGADLGDVNPLLDRIEPYAATGIPGTAQLRHDFLALYEQMPRAGRGLLPTSWMNDVTAWAHLRAAPQPAPAADPSAELLQAASARLADGDVAGAVEQTLQLNDTYKPVFASWLEDAQARVAADTIAERTSDMVAKTLRAPAAK